MPTRMERRQARIAALRRDVLIWSLELIAALAVALLARAYVFSLTTVQGPSMRETLHSGQVVAVDKLYFHLHGYSRGSVVICHFPNSEEFYVKRIIGLPGDTVAIREGVTYINGQPQIEDYVDYPAEEDFGPIVVAENSVFVMGDNRANSHDSRTEGAIPEDLVIGRVTAVLFPIEEAYFLLR